MNKKWNDGDIKWLHINYNKLGPKYAASILNKSYISIINKAHKLKLKYERNNNIKSHLFTTDFCKESVYLLGYMFADGYVSKSKKGYEIAFHCDKSDIDNIIDIFNYTGKWNILNRKDNIHTLVRCYDSNLGQFLLETDYHVKSLSSANKILSHIPIDLIRFFFLGLIDGDGCWYYSNNNRQFIITGHMNHNWNYLFDLYSLLNIEYHYKQNETKTGNNSQIRIFKKSELKKFINFIWPNKIYELGLSRKYDKAMQILDRC